MIYAVLIVWGLAMTGWGIYWRSQAEDLFDENLTFRFAAEPVTEKPQNRAPIAVTPAGDGGMDDLLLEVLMPAPRSIPDQRRPGGA